MAGTQQQTPPDYTVDPNANATAATPPDSTGIFEGQYGYTDDGNLWKWHTSSGLAGLGGGYWEQVSVDQAVPSTTTSPGGVGQGQTGGAEQPTGTGDNAPPTGTGTTGTAPTTTQDMNFQEIQDQVDAAQANINDPKSHYNIILADPNASPEERKQAVDEKNQDIQNVMHGANWLAADQDRRKKMALGGLTEKEAAEIDQRTTLYRIQAANAAVQLKQENLKLQLAADPKNAALAQQATELANQAQQLDNQAKQADANQKALEQKWGIADWPELNRKLKLANQSTELANQGTAEDNAWKPALNTATINQSQAATAASLEELAVHKEELRRAQQGEIESFAQDLDTAVRNGRMTRIEALALLDDHMQGVTPFQRQQEANKQLSGLASDAMSNGMLWGPGQAKAMNDQYAAIGNKFGMPVTDVPASGMNIPQFAQSLGMNLQQPYTDAQKGIAPPGGAMNSLGIGTDWRGLDMRAVQRAIDSYTSTGGQGGAAVPAPASSPDPIALPGAVSVPTIGTPAPMSAPTTTVSTISAVVPPPVLKHYTPPSPARTSTTDRRAAGGREKEN